MSQLSAEDGRTDTAHDRHADDRRHRSGDTGEDCERRGMGQGIDPSGDDRRFRHVNRLRDLDEALETARKPTSARLMYLINETSGSKGAGRKVASLLIDVKDDDREYANPAAYIEARQKHYENKLPQASAQLALKVLKEAKRELHKLHKSLVLQQVRQPPHRTLSAPPPQFPGPQLSVRISSCLPVRVGPVAQSAQSRREIREACMQELLSSDGAMALQQAADDVADLACAGYSSMYSVKKPGQRGRILPAAQLGAARQVVHGKLRTKALRSGATTFVHSYAPSHSQLGESDDDSDGDVRRHSEPAQADQPPSLPHGDAKRYQRKPPAMGCALVGWPIMALFADYDEQPYAEQKWHQGVIVSYDEDEELDHPYLSFFPTDSVWERVDLPDDTVVFLKGSAADIRLTVSEDMLPGDDDL